MSSYRPKSLDDINNLYDSEMEAKNAIKREFSKIEPQVRKPSSALKKTKPSPAANRRVKEERSKIVEDVSGDVNKLIRQFAQEQPKRQKSTRAVTPDGKPVAKRGNMSDPAAPVIASSLNKNAKKTEGYRPLEPLRKVSATKTEKPARKANTKPEKIETNDDETEIEIKEPINRSAPAQSEKLSDLMDDYVRIMNDQDDESDEAKRASLFRKKNRKKSDEEADGENPTKEEASDEAEEEQPSEPTEQIEEEQFEIPSLYDEIPNDEEEEPEEEKAEEAEEYTEASQSEEKAEQGEGPVSDEVPQEEEVYDEPYDEAPSETEEYADPEEYQNGEEYGEYIDQAEEGEYAQGEEYADEYGEEYSDEYAQGEEPENAGEYYQPMPTGGHMRSFVRAVLGMVLVIGVIATALVASLVLVFHVNEDKPGVAGKYYLTCDNDYENVSINSGDLVICSKATEEPIEENKAVVYIDRENKKFTFGINSNIVTAEDGKPYYIINEKAIEKDNVIGTVAARIPKAGKIISLVCAHYTIIIVALFALCTLIILVLTLLLKKREYIYVEDDYDAYYNDEQGDSEGEEYGEQYDEAQYEDGEAPTDEAAQAEKPAEASNEEFGSDDLFSDL